MRHATRSWRSLGAQEGWSFARVRYVGVLLAVLLPVCAFSAGPTPPSNTVEKPNILLIVADDLGYADLGVVGSEIKTPTMDRLAETGVLFTQFHTAPSCAPTRAMLLSGNNNHVAGVARQDTRGLGADPFAGTVGIPVQGYEAALSGRIVPFPRLLKEVGYHTSIVGKWHLGFELENGPGAAGFERSWVMLDGAGAHFSGKGLVEGGATYRHDGQRVEWPENSYSTEFYTDRLIEFIAESLQRDQPFFALAAYTSPHWPLQVPDDYLDLYQGQYEQGYDMLREQRFEQLIEAGVIPGHSTFPHRNPAIKPWEELTGEDKLTEARKMELYAAMVDNLDDHIGRLLNFIDERGELDNTLVIVMGDNGAAGEDMYWLPFTGYLRETYDASYERMGKPGSFVSYGPQWAEAGSAPFSRYKAYTRQGGIVAPLIMSGPYITRSARPDASYLTVMDLAPTFLEIAGAKYPDSEGIWPIQGTSLVDYLSGDAEEIHSKDDITVMFHWGNASLRQGDWKLVTPYSHLNWVVFDESSFELFNLATDPGETINLAEQEREKYVELLTLWRRERRRLGIILPEDL